MNRIENIAGEIRVVRITGRVFPSNAYLIPTGSGRDCVLVDPGLDHELIEEGIGRTGFSPRAVLCTHGHFDHLGSASRIQQEYGIPVYMHRADAPTARSSNFLLMAMKIDRRIAIPDITHFAGDDTALTIAGMELRIRAAPGHTPGSSIISMANLVFSGDTVYSRGVGLSGLPGEDAAQLRTTLQRLLAILPDAAIVCPGHGPESTLADIKRSNGALNRFLAPDIVTTRTECP